MFKWVVAKSISYLVDLVFQIARKRSICNFFKYDLFECYKLIYDRFSDFRF